MAAKDFLISRIMTEADAEKIPISEVERKMLYFSEKFDTLPDIWDVSQEFDKSYKASSYEKKMAKLIRNGFKHDSKKAPELESQWKEAARLLGREDHYLSVMLSQAGLGRSAFGIHLPDWVWQLLILACILPLFAFWGWLSRLGDRLSARERLIGWGIVAAVMLVLYRVGPGLMDRVFDLMEGNKK